MKKDNEEEIDKQYEQIEFDRGKKHAEAGRPPSCRVPAYLKGYEAGGGKHFIPT